ncbi:MAG: hypothetical protein EPO61_05280 [Nitrospirae bacterium]|nr:MAG: hypothetical protein EPO61_05280 [Nitrospirota bacterium]
MTLATGKSGKYRYYKCTNRITRGADSCASGNLPMDKLDRLVLEALADRVFVPGRVRAMLEALRKRLSQARTSDDGQIKQLTQELKSLQGRLDKLYEAVEQGLLPMDATLTERAHKLQVQRQALLTEIAGRRRHRDLPQAILAQKHIQTFCTTLRAKLLDQASGLGKAYLKLLVEEIRCHGREIHLKGSYGALAQAVGEAKPGTFGRVPSFGLDWLPGQDSNLRPPD